MTVAPTARRRRAGEPESLMSRDALDENVTRADALGHDPGQVGSDSGGQSGDTQGLSQLADTADESVEELADTGQTYEADAVQGVEDAADHPERPVFSHEDPRGPSDIGPDRGSD
jgi:hypothetical protein